MTNLTPEAWSNRDTNPFYGSEIVNHSSKNHIFVKYGNHSRVRGLVSTVAGNVKITMPDGSTPTIAVSTGIVLKGVRVETIFQTGSGTTATITYGLT